MTNTVKIEKALRGSYYVNVNGNWAGDIEKQDNRKWTIRLCDYVESDIPTKREAVAITKAIIEAEKNI